MNNNRISISDERIRHAEELREIIEKQFLNTKIVSNFLKRLKHGNLTRDEDDKSHFCVYFAAYDPTAKEVFIGHHKKSGLWLFNGGHIDKDENLNQTLIREIKEEWGLDGKNFEIKLPELLTITEIYNPTKQPCRTHYDLWYLIKASKINFKPEESNLLEEFYEAGWKNLQEARNLIKDKSTLEAVDFIKDNCFV